jgi:tripartite-type tricarboxylate transporter receptor subunit TctC
MASINRRQTLQLGLGALPALAATPALAQAPWPARSVHILLPFGAGGAVDTVCRLLFAKATERLKQTFIIENRTGGHTMVAASATLQQPKDGYWFYATGAQFLINPVLMKDLPFDFATAFQPVARVAIFPQMLAVRADFPAKNMAEFVAHAKANPGKVSWGTPPAAGMAHMAGALLQSKLDIKLNHIPYRLATEAVRDVGGGQIDCVIMTTSTIQPALQGNKARILALTGPKRLESMPDIPTIAETVIPGYSTDDWFGLFAQRGVPAEIGNQLRAALVEAAREPDVVAKLAPLGIVLPIEETATFDKFLGDQRIILTQLIKETGIKLE